MVRWTKLGIIAGGGALPLRIAASCRARGDALSRDTLGGFC